MRSFSVIVLIFMYFMSSLGLKVESHFCGGEPIYSAFLTQISADQMASDDFAQEESEGCCRDKITLIKIDDGKSQSWAWSFPPVQEIGFISSFFSNWVVSRNFQIIDSFVFGWKDPPDSGKSFLFLIYRSLLI